MKIALLSSASRDKLDRINRAFNDRVYSAGGATAYDQIHRYGEAEQHEYPAHLLVTDVWAPEGYGRALELGAGSGYFTVLIARRARSLVALEQVPDMQRVLRARYFHRRPEVFAALGRALCPGGRLFLVEPHHNLRRVARLCRKYFKYYRARDFWANELNWATHDFLTRGEFRSLCRRGGFEDVRISTYWFPYSRRLAPDPRGRLRLERALGFIPGLRHFAGILAVEARRSQGAAR